MNVPVLTFRDNKLPFVMYKDGSALGFGAVLMQLDVRGKHYAVAYTSPPLNKAESNYSVIHQEILAVVWGS